MGEFRFPSGDELDRMVEAGRRARLATQEAGDRLNGFTPTDLGDWMALCAKAGVPAVPALRVATGPTSHIWAFDEEPPAEHVEAVRTFWRDVAAAQERFPAGWMLRWSCCSMAEVKDRLGHGNASWHRDLMDIRADDFRAFDLIGEFPRSTISVWARPWMPFAQADGYPVEYRAFVLDGRLTGIANYYPQRDLPDDGSTRRDLDAVGWMTAALIAAQDRPLNMPAVSRTLDLSRNHFTADFGRLPDGAVVFLEGGPPHTAHWGAHPCCFWGREPDGVALAASAEAKAAMGLREPPEGLTADGGRP